MATTALEKRLGITRVARVTGLDRTGVEVACAVRPLGHVLQVSQGKGETFAAARASAIAEAAELWAAERVDPTTLLHGSRKEWAERYGARNVWDAAALGSAGELVAPQLWSTQTRIAWRWATRLAGSGRVLVPAQAVHCPPGGAAALGPAVVRWSSNAMGAHLRRSRAVEHAILEALERDRLARALPGGFTRKTVSDRLLVPATLAHAVGRRAQQLEGRGFTIAFLAISSAPPCVAALLVDQERGPIPLTAGYACRRSVEAACLAALLEAAQSRLTDIHGAREDVSPPDHAGLQRLAQWLKDAKPKRSAAQLKPWKGSLNSLIPGAAVVDLAPRELGLHVVKVIAPSLKVSELL